MAGKLQWGWGVVILFSMSSMVPWGLFFMSNLSHPVLLLDYINRLITYWLHVIYMVKIPCIS